MPAVTTSLPQCLWAAIAATMSIHAIMTPPNAVPCGLAWWGMTMYLVSTVLSPGLLGFGSAMSFSPFLLP
jgi:hypothetical protein